VKLIFSLLFICVALTGCISHPQIESKLIDESTLWNEEVSNETKVEPLMVDNTDCLAYPLDLTGNACNVLAWQSYMATLLFLSELERQQQLSFLTNDEIDTLKKALLLTHTNEVLAVRKDNINKLEQMVSNYPFPLDQLLLTHLVFHKNILDQSEQLSLTIQSLNNVKTELTETKVELQKAQKKIDAITNIEQQLNSEGNLSDDTKK
jgi:hypothetical protein